VHGLLPENQDVERVSIIAKGARDKPVVRRIVDGTVEHAV
jgi:hypothetical protein